MFAVRFSYVVDWIKLKNHDILLVLTDYGMKDFRLKSFFVNEHISDFFVVTSFPI